MPYQVQTTTVADVLLLTPKVFGDERGFFFESFNQRDFEQAIGQSVNFVQDNHSRSRQGVLRGLHFQTEHAQGKLVRVTDGEVFDVAVDIRPQSPTFGRWAGHLLSGENKQQLWVPPGLAHGFLVLSETADFLYKTTDYYYPEYERSLVWNDIELNIDWPVSALPAGAQPTVSAKDAPGTAMTLAELLKQ